MLKEPLERQYQEKLKKEKELEKQYFDSLSEDEQVEYLKKQDMERKEALNSFLAPFSFMAQAGIKRYY